MTSARYANLRWQKGAAYVSQGNKGNMIPYNAVRGGNGTFLCIDGAKLYLDLRTSDGNYYSEEIINVVKEVNGWERLTNKRIALLKEKFVRTTFVIEDGRILGLEQIVHVY